MEYISFDKAMKERFGGKVYRLSLSSGCTCPNRDGKCGIGVCIFCSEGGSGEFASAAVLPIAKQIEDAKAKVESKLSKSFAGYVAYFQSFTNTYVHDEKELEQVRSRFTEAINYPQVLALSIATRPDCLQDEVIDMLSELNKIKPVWVELGLQTIHDDTAKLINRGYDIRVYDDAVRRLHEAGIEVITHVIIGLPGEDEDKIKKTVEYVGRVTDGIKLQVLQVLKGSRLATEIEKGNIQIPEYTLETYAKLLEELLALLPEHVVVHRLTGDPPRKLIISPLWTTDKKRVLNYITKTLSC